MKIIIQVESTFSYSALFQTQKFQSVQYLYNGEMDEFIYIYYHPDGIADN